MSFTFVLFQCPIFWTLAMLGCVMSSGCGRAWASQVYFLLLLGLYLYLIIFLLFHVASLLAVSVLKIILVLGLKWLPVGIPIVSHVGKVWPFVISYRYNLASGDKNAYWFQLQFSCFCFCLGEEEGSDSLGDLLCALFNVLSSFFPFLCGIMFFCPFDILGYISTSINDGPGCLMLRCPDPTCDAAIGQDMINLLVSDEDKQKYARYLLRSYIEDNKKVCPRYEIMMLIV